MKQKLLLSFSAFILFCNSYYAQNHLVQIGVKDSIYSNTLGEQRDIYIHLPENYEKHKTYPVTYIIDGDVLLPTVTNVHQFYNGGFIPEMILIGISNAKNRTRDLTTSKISTKYGRPFQEENGKADKFLTFIEKELIPWIETKYNTTDYRTLIGHSYGGLFTVYTLVNRPSLFSNYLAIDPSLDWNHQKLIKESKEILQTGNYENKALYFSLSGQLNPQNPETTIENVMDDSSDATLFSRSNITFHKYLKEHPEIKLSTSWNFYPEELHGTIVFPSIKDGLISLFKWYQMEQTSKFNSFETPKEELYKIIKNREAKLLNHFGYKTPPYPEDLLNALGYMSLEMNQKQKAKMFFKFAIAYYPKSPNTYDSMSDFYKNIGDKKNALKFSEKAFQISNSESHKEKIEELKKL